MAEEHAVPHFAPAVHRRGLKRPPLRDWVITAVLIAAGAVAGHLLAGSGVWVSVRAGIYQAITVFGREPRRPQRTATILLDDGDFWSDAQAPGTAAGDPRTDLGGRVPTNRAYLAKLIRQLDAAGVGVIALDFDLRSPLPAGGDFADYSAEDEALRGALALACAHGRRVVLASELLAAADGPSVAPSVYDTFSGAGCVQRGYIQLPRDIRRLPGVVVLGNGEEANSLALAAVNAADPARYRAIVSGREVDFPYSEFIPESAFLDRTEPQDVFSGRDIFGATAAELAPKLAARIVLIGANWHSLGSGQGAVVDQHPSPGGPLPGVLLHANYIEAALDNRLLRPFPAVWAEFLDIAVVLGIVLVGALKIRAAWKWSAVAVSFVLVLAFSYLFLQTFGLFLDFFFPLIFLGLHAGYEHIHEWRHAAKQP